MKKWFQGKRGGLFAFALISLLVAGGLGWATRAALRLEQERLAQQASGDHHEKVRRALWRLDSRISAILAREDSRPFSHYSAIFAPPLALDGAGVPAPPGSVLEPSPLLHAELPPWMLLHFQADARGWESPQVLSTLLKRWLTARSAQLPMPNVTPQRQHLLTDLSSDLPADRLIRHARRHAGEIKVRDRVLLTRHQLEQSLFNANANQDVKDLETWRDYASRGGMQSKLAYSQSYGVKNEQRVAKDVALLNFYRNGEEWLHTWQLQSSQNPPALNQLDRSVNRAQEAGRYRYMRIPISSEVVISMSPMVGLWLPSAGGERPLPRQRLVVLRLVRVEQKDVCQGIVLDGDRLAELLAEEVQELFPGARIVPADEPAPETLAETMTTLPLRLDPGEAPAADRPGWTTLRIGLSLAWAAALIALLAVALGGWSLLDLSERRIRFVSAVTHELRTPLTTLRLYLDMLLGGMVKAEPQRDEYLRTMEAETDRLTRLVGNVLDFSRLENQGPRMALAAVTASEVLTQADRAWRGRCATQSKELVVEDSAVGAALHTDAGLLGQVLANLLDNACKYSREAADRHIWLRCRRERDRVIFEVEDRGPGIPTGERRAIFRPFRRGREADATTGGVGLGLALAERWTRLLGGRLTLCSPGTGGACFRVELPAIK